MRYPGDVATATPTDGIAAPEDTPRVAPGALELVRTFVNTVDIETGDDVLGGGEPKAVKAWMAEQGLLADDARVTAADAKRTVDVREALRALLLANNGEPLDPAAVAVLNDVAGRSPLEAQFGAEGTITVTGRDDGIDGALGQLLAVVVQAVSDGTWSRLKACKAHDCEWAFYDRSRNRSGQWCVMAVCGNRSKARSYRDRNRTD
jgi:predicted RNA-binding Zn ribbon-like protein